MSAVALIARFTGLMRSGSAGVFASSGSPDGDASCHIVASTASSPPSRAAPLTFRDKVTALFPTFASRTTRVLPSSLCCADAVRFAESELLVIDTSRPLGCIVSLII